LIEQTIFYSSPSWLLGDHLGSTSMVTDASGVMVSEVRYSAFGETRYQNGTLTTDYLYTGQRQEAEIGLYYYVARWYDPAIGRFIQADSIVPDPASALGFDRYAYTNNNPLNFIDPSGHFPLIDGDIDLFDDLKKLEELVSTANETQNRVDYQKAIVFTIETFGLNTNEYTSGMYGIYYSPEAINDLVSNDPDGLTEPTHAWIFLNDSAFSSAVDLLSTLTHELKHREQMYDRRNCATTFCLGMSEWEAYRAGNEAYQMYGGRDNETSMLLSEAFWNIAEEANPVQTFLFANEKKGTYKLPFWYVFDKNDKPYTREPAQYEIERWNLVVDLGEQK